VLEDLVKFEPNMNKVLGQGTDQPGLHAQAVTVPVYVNARYVPFKDTPIYGDNLGPHCYGVPFPGITLNDGTTGTSGGTGTIGATGSASTTHAATKAMVQPAAGSSLAGSPGEAELVRELAGMSLGTSPANLPGWSSLLLAPLYRGTTVQLTVSRT
jgi:phospholipid/cholesterol/gamma-HCH transport system substrate-binding protein